ncbi:MAG: polysaccharide deacetylase family protein [Caldithrix sp.]|nr:MAG: polysaccharide deacetylase family protein [Caldithrix sp.]
MSVLVKLTKLEMKRKIKLFLSSMFYYSQLFGLVRLWNNFNDRKLTVLTFHRVTHGELASRGLPTISITMKNFELLIQFIKKHFKVISLHEFLTCVQEESKLPSNCLILSFDDGYEELSRNALPILKRHQLPAILFVPTAAVDKKSTFWWDAVYTFLKNAPQVYFDRTISNDRVAGPYLKRFEKITSLLPEERDHSIFDLIESLQSANAEIRERVLEHFQTFYQGSSLSNDTLPGVLKWNEVKKFSDSVFEIGSHTVNHQFLTSVGEKDAKNELAHSKDVLEGQLNKEVSCFSYPGGKYDEKTAQLVGEAGYACAFTSDEGLNSSSENLYKLKRINISDDNLVNSKDCFSKAIAAWCLFLNK